MRFGALILITVALTFSGCHSRHSWRFAPFQTTLGTLTFNIPKRDDVHLAYLTSGQGRHSFAVEGLCEKVNRRNPQTSALEKVLPLDCADFDTPLVNEFGAMIWVQEVRLDTRFNRLVQKPINYSLPPRIPLKLLGGVELSRPSSTSEWYEMSRLQGVYPSAYYTTNAGWPVVVCSDKRLFPPQLGSACQVGFLIDDAFVEARIFSTMQTYPPDQRQVFEAASAVDRKLRTFITSQ